MFHMRRAYILLLVFLLAFGCIEDKVFPSDRTEQILSSDSQDLDGDGITDYSIYTFSPVTKGGVKIQRQVTVSTFRTSTYTSVNSSLTDVGLLNVDTNLDEFSKSRAQADGACSKNIGLLNVVCSDITSCSRLCSSASIKCKGMVQAYDEVVAGSMISYVQDNNELRSLILDSRRMVLSLRNTTDEQRNIFLGKISSMISHVADINANPLYNNPQITLCEHSDFGISYLLTAAKLIGGYETTVDSYHYTVAFSLTPMEKSEALGTEIGGMGVTDMIPSSVIGKADQVTSIQDILASDESQNAVVSWNSAKPSKTGYLFAYDFTSTVPPETAIQSLRTPEITVKTIDLSGLGPTNSLVLMLNDSTDNYYLAFGIALGLTIAVLILAYTMLSLIMTLISEKIAGGSLTAGFRRAFGRTAIRWKGDLVIAVLFLAGGFYVSSFVAIQPQTIPPLVESIDFLIKSGFGSLGVGLTAIGVVLAYLGIENMGKITLLEKAYGMVIKQEKDITVARVASLKEKIKELEGLVEKFTQEGFEVSKEYDVLSSAKSHDIAKLAKTINPRTKAIIDEQLSAVESAVNRLEQKKKMADENWPKWKETIAKILDEQDEVFENSLVVIPASLRTWALSRYFKEIEGEGVVLEHNGIKKRKLSPERLVHEFVLKGLLKAAIIIRNDSIETAEFAEGSGTVTKALALKLRNYLKSLAKKLGQHDPQSFVAIGSDEVIVYMKGRAVESVVIVKKDKFNESVESWKNKIKMLESE